MTDQTAPRRVLILIKGLGLGGAERLLVDSLPFLDRQRFDYHFAYMLPWKSFLAPEIERAGFKVHCLGMNSIVQLPRAAKRLNDLNRHYRFDLIHAHLPIAGVLARIAGRRWRVPVFYTEHNVQERYSRLTRRANALTYGLNSHVLAVSEEVAASIRRNGLHRKTRVTTLLNGVPVEQIRKEAGELNGLREELNIPADQLVVGTVAVFRTQKRLGDWLQVAQRVADRRPDVTFLLVGDGPEAESVRATVRRLKLEDRVVMPGFRADGRRLVAVMDAFLMTSEFEGLPVALLEAMALGKPVVATAAGGIGEVVTDGREGYLARIGDVDGLSTRVLELISEAGLREEMGRRGAEKVEGSFHLRERVRMVEEWYGEGRGRGLGLGRGLTRIQRMNTDLLEKGLR